MAVNAPNGPGTPSVWAPSAKDFLGTSASNASPVYFTGAQGMLTEVFYPSPDLIQNIDMEFVVEDAAKTMGPNDAEQKLQTNQTVALVDQRALVWQAVTVANNGAWQITRTIFTDPARPSVVQRVVFQALQSGKTVQDFNLYVLNHPGIDNQGGNDNSRTLTNGNRIMLVASKPNTNSSALAVSLPWATSGTNLEVSSGFVGVNDGWTDLFGGADDRTMSWNFDGAYGGNVAQMGWLDFGTNRGSSVSFDLVLSFGANEQMAMDNASATLSSDLNSLQTTYAQQWNSYCQGLNSQGGTADDQYYLAAMTLKSTQDKSNGAMVAGLGVPWGPSNGDQDNGGYHLVWARDLFKFASALIAAGDTNSANMAVNFLFNTQMQTLSGSNPYSTPGRFPQNSFDSGVPDWNATQMDEASMPIILAWKLNRLDLWPKMKMAADFVINNGPWTQEERWEEMSGYSPSTIAAEIAGLVCAADFATRSSDTNDAAKYLQFADAWRNNVANWTFTTNGPYGDSNYFIRLDQNQEPCANIQLTFGNGVGTYDPRTVLDGGFLELVRLGAMSPSNWTILETIPKYDNSLKQTIPGKGDAWFRYNHDGYGEHNDGTAYNGGNGLGRGRLWPIFTAERGIYEIARSGNGANGQPYLAALKSFSSQAGFIPEQVWNISANIDGWETDTPANDVPGTATDSMRPLSWAMGEYINLVAAMKNGHNDAPSVVIRRYASDQPQVTVSFNVNAPTVWGQNVYLVGNHALLGAWNTRSGIQLSPVPYPVWSATVSLPASTAFQYKYVKMDQSGKVIWESAANRSLTFPAVGTATQRDTFRQ
ncbi:MAG: glycoside hydrolase family 15 protein [Limisphaerales bacterium]